MTRVLVSAGDASGEMHAAAVIDALRERVPGLEVLALGGPALEKAGADILVPQRELAVGGLFEVLGDLGGVASAWRRMTRALRDERPAAQSRLSTARPIHGDGRLALVAWGK